MTAISGFGSLPIAKLRLDDLATDQGPRPFPQRILVCRNYVASNLPVAFASDVGTRESLVVEERDLLSGIGREASAKQLANAIANERGLEFRCLFNDIFVTSARMGKRAGLGGSSTAWP